jgi:hypothetical protein
MRSGRPTGRLMHLMQNIHIGLGVNANFSSILY